MAKKKKKGSYRYIVVITISVLLAADIITSNILISKRDDIPIFPFIIVAAILIFALVFVLTTMKRDATREMRDDPMFNDDDKKQNRAFLPWLQGDRATIIHDLEDEERHHNQQ